MLRLMVIATNHNDSELDVLLSKVLDFVKKYKKNMKKMKLLLLNTITIIFSRG